MHELPVKQALVVNVQLAQLLVEHCGHRLRLLAQPWGVRTLGNRNLWDQRNQSFLEWLWIHHQPKIVVSVFATGRFQCLVIRELGTRLDSNRR